ncbi:epoxyqueuosine reductase QueH [Desulfovibrio sp. OttesenSCG-928-F07]|nr:epoxyqueuosine reductase QueH [Desulfovibrio sp. OttesenSCG-928-F07]
MKILLHICCGPCAIMPIKRLQDEGHEVTGLFYNPNIHPLAEYLRRREGAAQVADRYGIKVIWATEDADYNTVNWLHMIHGQEDTRCGLCWNQRIERSYNVAVNNGFDAFTSSLLYSRYQQHDFIAKRAAELAGAVTPNSAALPVAAALPAVAPAVVTPASTKSPCKFYYKDFRTDWQAGIDISKEWGVYRQPYCGCILSENERYTKALKRENQKLKI